jgi:type IV pilus assembly protein PilV
MVMAAKHTYQSGMALLEALIGILIFSIGILAMVGMQAASINAVADAQYRIEAVNEANQLLAEMWVNVDRSNPGTITTSLLAFAHQTTGAPQSCAFGGAAATSAAVTDWATHLNSGGPGGRPLLPGSDATMQQVAVDTGVSNRVTVTVCWLAPGDTTPRRHTVVAYVN